ncbi:hypothetical protein GCM10010402_04970 [Actinomadura luteofluorescens]
MGGVAYGYRQGLGKALQKDGLVFARRYCVTLGCDANRAEERCRIQLGGIKSGGLACDLRAGPGRGRSPLKRAPNSARAPALASRMGRRWGFGCGVGREPFD